MIFTREQREKLKFPSFYRFRICSLGMIEERNLRLPIIHIDNNFYGKKEIFGVSDNTFSTRNFEERESLERYLFELRNMVNRSTISLPSNPYLKIQRIGDGDSRLRFRRGLIRSLKVEDFQSLGEDVSVSLEDLRMKQIKLGDEQIPGGYGGFSKISLGLGRRQL